MCALIIGRTRRVECGTKAQRERLCLLQKETLGGVPTAEPPAPDPDGARPVETVADCCPSHFVVAPSASAVGMLRRKKSSTLMSVVSTCTEPKRGKEYTGQGYIADKYAGHDYMGHNCMRHNYIQSYIRHAYTGLNYIGPKFKSNSYIGQNYIAIKQYRT